MMFDVKDFYQSIKEKLLNKAIGFAEQTVLLSEKDKLKEIIFHARKSLLFNKNELVG